MSNRRAVTERHRARRRNAVAALGATAASLGLITATGAASASASTATINACYNKNTGVLRYVSSASSCNNNEYSISWNRVGPQAAPALTPLVEFVQLAPRIGQRRAADADCGRPARVRWIPVLRDLRDDSLIRERRRVDGSDRTGRSRSALNADPLIGAGRCVADIQRPIVKTHVHFSMMA